MEARRVEDPAVYADLVLSLLLQASARHNLFLGILNTLQRSPTIYPVFHLWVVEDDGEVVGAALQTPPHNIAIAEPGASGAVDALVTAPMRGAHVSAANTARSFVRASTS